MTTIEELSIGSAWLRAFEITHRNRGATPTPISVTFSNALGAHSYDRVIQEYLDSELTSHKMPSTSTVAGTIFPKSLWSADAPRNQLFDLYNQAFPRIQRSCRNNKKGTYFRRMTSFGNKTERINQLEHVINYWNSGHRRASAYQLAIFSPLEDHTNSPYGAFPCLHQISITPHGTNGKDGMNITGYYATQHIFNKAFGNYIGLYNLGLFMAHEMGLELKTVTCIAANPQIGTINNQSLSVAKQKQVLEDLKKSIKV